MKEIRLASPLHLFSWVDFALLLIEINSKYTEYSFDREEGCFCLTWPLPVRSISTWSSMEFRRRFRSSVNCLLRALKLRWAAPLRYLPTILRAWGWLRDLLRASVRTNW